MVLLKQEPKEQPLLTTICASEPSRDGLPRLFHSLAMTHLWCNATTFQLPIWRGKTAAGQEICPAAELVKKVFLTSSAVF